MTLQLWSMINIDYNPWLSDSLNEAVLFVTHLFLNLLLIFNYIRKRYDNFIYGWMFMYIFLINFK